MSLDKDEQESFERLREVYPDATEEKLKEAHRRLSAYVRLVLRIQEHLEQERDLD
ncbi:MAG: hypothetical protein IH936_04925 [Acidobacteria bacterium]|nr:hypothetical protein [Acidobacteriota bacterium]